jgi:chitinase
MIRSGWLRLVLLLVLFGGESPAQNRIIGYYPMWSRSALPAQNVRFDILTHVIHAFAWPQSDGSLAFSETAVDTALIRAAHLSGRKILLSFGGAAESGAFPQVSADSTLRSAFIANVVAHLTAYEYDGADIDWEGPANATERTNEAILISQLRAAFTTAGKPWLITMAVGVTNWSGQWHDFTALRASVDWFNAMTYDFHGSWSAHAGHNAPLYQPPGDYDGSVDLGIRYLNQTRGIPGSQLALGLPFYGKEFQASALNGPKTEPTIDITYADIPGKLSHNWAYLWDSIAQVPYLLAPSGTKLDTFDDSTSLSLKCAYAKSSGLTGVMIWALGQDLFAGRQPLLEAVGTAMNRVTGIPAAQQIPNAFVLEQNFPNPFNPATTIRYHVPRLAHVRLDVYTVLGQQVATLVDALRQPGVYEVRFDASALPTGVYMCRMSSAEAVATVKLLLIR